MKRALLSIFAVAVLAVLVAAVLTAPEPKPAAAGQRAAPAGTATATVEPAASATATTTPTTEPATSATPTTTPTAEPATSATPTTTPTAEPATSAPSGRRLSTARAAVVVGCGLTLLTLALASLLSRRSRRDPVHVAEPEDVADFWLAQAPAVPAVEADAEEALDERRGLVRALIAVSDDEDAYVARRAMEALRRAGVEVIAPEPGDAFDPRRHSINGVVETDDPRAHKGVVALVRRGFSDHGRLVREAEVQVSMARGTATREAP